jgi:hypothetical protein
MYNMKHRQILNPNLISTVEQNLQKIIHKLIVRTFGISCRTTQEKTINKLTY